MAINLKKVFTKETFDDLVDYYQNGNDAISMIAKGFDAEKIVTRFQTLADLELVPEIREKWGYVDGNQPFRAMPNVPNYIDKTYNSFALEDMNYRMGRLKFPLVAGHMLADNNYFSENGSCPNYDKIKNLFEEKFNVRINDDANNGRIAKFKEGRVRKFLRGAKSVLKTASRFKEKLFHGTETEYDAEDFFLKSGKGIGKAKVFVTGRMNDLALSQPDKIVAMVNVYTNKTISSLYKKFSKELKGSPKLQHIKFISQILADIFVCQALDMGGDINKKVDNALKLQLANAIANYGSISPKTFDYVKRHAEVCANVVMTTLGLKPEDIIKNRKKMGIVYLETPSMDNSLDANEYFNKVLYGETKNLSFVEGIDNENKKEKTIYFTRKSPILSSYKDVAIPVEEKIETPEPILAPKKEKTFEKDSIIPDKDLFEDKPIDLTKKAPVEVPKSIIPDEDLFESAMMNSSPEKSEEPTPIIDNSKALEEFEKDKKVSESKLDEKESKNSFLPIEESPKEEPKTTEDKTKEEYVNLFDDDKTYYDISKDIENEETPRRTSDYMVIKDNENERNMSDYLVIEEKGKPISPKREIFVDEETLKKTKQKQAETKDTHPIVFQNFIKVDDSFTKENIEKQTENTKDSSEKGQTTLDDFISQKSTQTSLNDFNDEKTTQTNLSDFNDEKTIDKAQTTLDKLFVQDAKTEKVQPLTKENISTKEFLNKLREKREEQENQLNSQVEEQEKPLVNSNNEETQYFDNPRLYPTKKLQEKLKKHNITTNNGRQVAPSTFKQQTIDSENTVEQHILLKEKNQPNENISLANINTNEFFVPDFVMIPDNKKQADNIKIYYQEQITAGNPQRRLVADNSLLKQPTQKGVKKLNSGQEIRLLRNGFNVEKLQNGLEIKRLNEGKKMLRLIAGSEINKNFLPTLQRKVLMLTEGKFDAKKLPVVIQKVLELGEGSYDLRLLPVICPKGDLIALSVKEVEKIEKISSIKPKYITYKQAERAFDKIIAKAVAGLYEKIQKDLEKGKVINKKYVEVISLLNSCNLDNVDRDKLVFDNTTKDITLDLAFMLDKYKYGVLNLLFEGSTMFNKENTTAKSASSFINLEPKSRHTFAKTDIRNFINCYLTSSISKHTSSDSDGGKIYKVLTETNNEVTKNTNFNKIDTFIGEIEEDEKTDKKETKTEDKKEQANVKPQEKTQEEVVVEIENVDTDEVKTDEVKTDKVVTKENNFKPLTKCTSKITTKQKLSPETALKRNAYHKKNTKVLPVKSTKTISELKF